MAVGGVVTANRPLLIATRLGVVGPPAWNEGNPAQGYLNPWATNWLRVYRYEGRADSVVNSYGQGGRGPCLQLTEKHWAIGFEHRVALRVTLPSAPTLPRVQPLGLGP